MWSIRRSHQHIKPEVLTEYLDRRIGGAALDRVDRQLASCDICQGEMASLRATVALLQQLPVATPRRSFVMAAPPPEPVWVRPSPPLRLPQWIYAGTASAAAIVLAILVSADATGLLVPDDRLVSQEAASPAAQPAAGLAVDQSRSLEAEPEAAIEVEAESEAAIEMEMEKATQFETLPTPAPLAVEAPMAEGAPVERSAAPVAKAAADNELAAPPPPGSGVAAARDGEGRPEIESLAAAPPLESPATASELRDRPVGDLDAVAAQIEAQAKPPGGEEKIPAAGPESRVSPEARQGGTALFWRVLEGLAAALGVLFLAGLVIRRRISRRAGLA